MPHQDHTTVVITGASAGVGRALARRFAQDGARIGLVARGRERLEETAAEVRARGGEALVLPLDVADADALENAAQQVEREFGPIDIWVNNAMVTVFSPVSKMRPEEYRRATEVTYLGTVNGTLAALKRMSGRNRGTIVQVGSALAYRAVPLQSAYCAAKRAIVGFTDSLRTELMHEGSNVNVVAVHLPAVNTPQFGWARNKTGRRARPLPPVFEPEVIANAIHHAAFNPRREYWLGWPTWKAILGEKLAPGLSDRIIAREAWDGQMGSDPISEQQGNLDSPSGSEYAARGRFSTEAQNNSPAVWADEHRTSLLSTAGLVLGLGAVGLAAFLITRNRQMGAHAAGPIERLGDATQHLHEQMGQATHSLQRHVGDATHHLQEQVGQRMKPHMRKKHGFGRFW